MILMSLIACGWSFGATLVRPPFPVTVPEALAVAISTTRWPEGSRTADRLLAWAFRK